MMTVKAASTPDKTDRPDIRRPVIIAHMLYTFLYNSTHSYVTNNLFQDNS